MVIDFHTHIFPDKIASATIEALSESASIPPHSDGTYDGLISKMERAGVDISVNLPVVTRPTQVDSIMRFSSEINSKYKKVISFAGIHPDSEDTDAILENIKQNGFLGIKLHPDYQGAFVDDPRYIRIMKKAKELDLITVTHAGLDGAFVGQEIKCTPTRVLRVLDALGGYDKLVLAHMGANELFNETLSELAGENVYFDTAYVLPTLGQEMFARILEKHGEDKVLFATDSPWQDALEQIEIIKSYGLDNETENKIFCENAKRLLKL